MTFQQTIKRNTYQVPAASQYDSIIASGMRVSGNDIKGESLRVEGQINSPVDVKRLMIAEGGVVEGDVKSDTVRVGGKVVGNIQAESLHVESTGVISGDVIVTTLSSEPGCVVHGNVTMKPNDNLGETDIVGPD